MTHQDPAQRIRLKRAYEAPSEDDGTRILVDRLWPRGVKKTDAKIDHWLKELAPSTQLRQWFGHDPELWPEFQQKYREEIAQHPQLLQQIRDLMQENPVTLIYAAHDEAHNNAVVIQQALINS